MATVTVSSLMGAQATRGNGIWPNVQVTGTQSQKILVCMILTAIIVIWVSRRLLRTQWTAPRRAAEALSRTCPFGKAHLNDENPLMWAQTWQNFFHRDSRSTFFTAFLAIDVPDGSLSLNPGNVQRIDVAAFYNIRPQHHGKHILMWLLLHVFNVLSCFVSSALPAH